MTLKFSEIIHTLPVSFSIDKKLPPGTFEWSCDSKTVFYPHLVMWWPWSLTFGAGIFRNVQHCPSMSVWLIIVCGLKTAFMSILGHVATQTFTIWTWNFQKCLTPLHKNGTLKWSYDSKMGFLSLYGHVATLTLWPQDLEFLKMLNTTPICLSIHKSWYLVYLSGVMAPKLNICPH